MQKKGRVLKIMGGLIILAVVILLLILPFLIDMLYDVEPPLNFFDTNYTRGEILDYYTELLSLLATVLLGVVAVVQTYKSQKKSDEINELQMDLAKRELAVVEKQYAEEQSALDMAIPKFEVKIVGYGGCYSRIDIEIKNISETMIAAFKIIKFEIYRNNDLHCLVERWKVKFQSISSGETQKFEMHTPEMCERIGQMGIVENWKNVKLVCKFSCDDCRGIKHFYSATLQIPNTKDFVGDFWDVVKIG